MRHKKPFSRSLKGRELQASSFVVIPEATCVNIFNDADRKKNTFEKH